MVLGGASSYSRELTPFFLYENQRKILTYIAVITI